MAEQIMWAVRRPKAEHGCLYAAVCGNAKGAWQEFFRNQGVVGQFPESTTTHWIAQGYRCVRIERITEVPSA